MKRKRKREPIVRAETEDGQIAGEAVIEILENQIRDNEPPETRQTLDRLMSLGESRVNAMRMLACVMCVEVFHMLNDQEAFNRERFVKNLAALPTLPDDD